METRNGSWRFPAEIALIGDAKAVVTQLVSALTAADGIAAERIAAGRARLQRARQQHGHFNAAELSSDAAPLLPQRAIKEIQRTVANDAIITCDAGENRIFMTHYFQTKGPGTFLQPSGVGGMGYAIPAALAAKLVYPHRQAVADCGDVGGSSPI